MDAIREVARVDAEALLLHAAADRQRRRALAPRPDLEWSAQMRSKRAAYRRVVRKQRERHAVVGLLWLRVPDAVSIRGGMWTIVSRPTWALPTFDSTAEKYPGLAALLAR